MIAMKKRPFLFFILLFTFVRHDTLLSAEEKPSDINVEGKSALTNPQETRIQALINGLSTTNPQEIEMIEAASGQFLSLFRESSTGDPQGCIILLHSDNAHPDWPQVIHPVREKLNDNSWCTLSIEIPDVTKRFFSRNPVSPEPSGDNATATTNADNTATNADKTLPDESIVFERIDAARQHLQQKGYSRNAYLGHGTGAAYALKYAANRSLGGSALILVEPLTPEPFSDFEFANLIESLRLPTLDYYFADSVSKNQFARYRQNAANKRTSANDAYVQIKAPLDRRYDEIGTKRLTQRVWGFLKQNTNQAQQTRPLPLVDKSLFIKSLEK